MLMYDVRQRLVDHRGEGLRWRISYTGDKPMAIEHPGLVGLGLQLGLDQPEINELIAGESFPAALRSPESAASWLGLNQWPYREAVAALIAAGERKRAS